jgi:DNA polymerase-3 subunit epsilon
MLGAMTGSSCALLEEDVLVVDCQATAAAPRGHLLELGWTVAGRSPGDPQALLIKLPPAERVPPAVARITGITDVMLAAAAEPAMAWRALAGDAARLPRQPAPTVAHFARFERPFLQSLAGGRLPLDVICTHEISRRLLPDLPRCTLRAVAGYFGRAVGTMRRSADHVAATAFVWQALARLLEGRGISTWTDLQAWLAMAAKPRLSTRRVWPMPRDVRLSLPDRPGVYRMLRTSGDVLYVGKAASLRTRVNSYFRKQHGIDERFLEMLSQARRISFDVLPTALEAALLEADEIKRHRPPYNIALTIADRALWFAARDLSARSARACSRTPLGPFPSAEMLDQFAALAQANREALGRGRWAPDAGVFGAGYARVVERHAELSRGDLSATQRLLRLGTRLWGEGRRDRDLDADGETRDHRLPSVWTPELVQHAIERLALRAALARRRARWLTRLQDAAVVWTEPGVSAPRLLVLDGGEIAVREPAAPASVPPVPPGHRRPTAARHEALTLARFDRVRVLTTELKRVAGEGCPIAVRFGTAPPLAGARLCRALAWV